MDVQNSFFLSSIRLYNSDYTRHNSRLYKIRTKKTNWCTRKLVLRHEIKIIIHILCLGMSLLMIRLGIKNSLASHVLVLYLHVVFFTSLIRTKTCCHVSHPKEFHENENGIVSSKMTVPMITFHEFTRSPAFRLSDILYGLYSANKYHFGNSWKWNHSMLG